MKLDQSSFADNIYCKLPTFAWLWVLASLIFNFKKKRATVLVFETLMETLFPWSITKNLNSGPAHGFLPDTMNKNLGPIEGTYNYKTPDIYLFSII